jgi:hypothetical protein
MKQAGTRILLYTGVLLALGGCGAPAVVSTPGPATAASALPITAEGMHRHIAHLASDELRGRDTPSPGLEAAAEYLVRESQRLGLQPAGEGGTYLQRWPYPRRQLSVDRTQLRVTGTGGAGELVLGRDFVAVGATPGEVTGGLVYLGRAMAPSPAGQGAGTLRDRVAVFALPGMGMQEREWRLLRNRQITQAREGEALALIHVLDPRVSPVQMRQMEATFARPARALGDPDAVPAFFVSFEAASRIFDASGLSLDEAWRQAVAGAVPATTLPGLTAVGGAPVEVLDPAMPPNVVAVLPGSDPALRDEYVVLTAHFDHVGVGQPVDGDSIYNGADDNASGTAGLLEVARAMSELPTAPRRSVIFLWVSGEEKGLLGSRWYSDHPTVPLEQIVANINVDMIGGDAHRDTVVIIGKEYSTLGGVVDEAQARLDGLNLIASDDIWPQERFFYRSDHFNFARKEIPALFFFTGVHRCYHRPCDDIDFVDTGKAARVANLILHTTLDVANAEARPQWDPAGLEEVRSLTR